MVSRTRDGNFGTNSGASPNTAFGGGTDSFYVFSGYDITSNIAMGDSADTLRIDWAEVKFTLAMGGGNDTIVIDSTADPDDPNQTTIIGYGNPTEAVRMATGNDSLTVIGDVQFVGGDIWLGDGADTAYFETTNVINSEIRAGNGDDTLQFVDGTFTLPILGGDGNDNITIDGGTFNGTIDGGLDSDTITVNGFDAGTNIVIDGSENADNSDTDVLDLSALTGTVTYDATNPENGVFTSITGETITFTNIENIIDPACFTRGTLIKTLYGERPVELLRCGDLIATKDNGYKPIKWIGSSALTCDQLRAKPNFCPILIPRNALGDGVPARDLIVSPQHRILISSKIVERMFDTSEVLIAAKHLVGIFGIRHAPVEDGVEYFHILFDQHEIIASNGAYSESLYLGKQALKSIPEQALEEILELFPELADDDMCPPAARDFATGRKSKHLAARHSKNNVTLCALAA